MASSPSPRPTPQQLLVRRVVALLILVAVITVAFSLIRALVESVSARFAEATPTPTLTTSKSTAPPREDLVACADADIQIDVTLEEGNEYTAGDTATVQAVITNVGGSTCLRDVGSRANEVYVVDAEGYRVWSSNRCPVKQKSRLVEMGAGARYQVTVIWPGTRNPKKCGELAAAVKPGEFSVFVSNGSAVSEPAPLTLN